MGLIHPPDGRLAGIQVMGSGVAGLSVSAELVDRGFLPTVVDRCGGPGPHGCSWWAGGMLAPGCEQETAEPIVVRLGQEAADWWQAHGAAVTRKGSLVVALGRDESALTQFARRTTGHRVLDGAQLAALEPHLEGRFRRGLFFPDEAHLDPRAALASLVAHLKAGGVEIQRGSAPLEGRWLTIDCRGLSARNALRDLRGVKGEMLILRSPEIELDRPVRLLHPRIPMYLVPRGDGVYMLGATAIESADRARVTARSVLELLSGLYALHPAFGEAEVLELGADARPAFLDNLPKIRQQGGVLHVNGFYRHGFLLAPALARMVGDWISKGIRPEVMDEDHR